MHNRPHVKMSSCPPVSTKPFVQRRTWQRLAERVVQHQQGALYLSLVRLPLLHRVNPSLQSMYSRGAPCTIASTRGLCSSKFLRGPRRRGEAECFVAELPGCYGSVEKCPALPFTGTSALVNGTCFAFFTSSFHSTLPFRFCFPGPFRRLLRS